MNSRLHHCGSSCLAFSDAVFDGSRPTNAPYRSRYRAPQLFDHWLAEGDAERIYKEAAALPIKDYLNPHVRSVEEEDPIEEVLKIMLESGVNRVPVVRDGKPVGIVSRRDLLKMVMNK